MIEWDKSAFFSGAMKERVLLISPDSNYHMAMKAVLTKMLFIPEEQIHRMARETNIEKMPSV